MSALIAMLIEILGPLLADLLKQLFEKWFNRAAARMPPGFTDTKEGQIAVMKEARRMLPFFAFFRKATLGRAIALAEKGTATDEEKDELYGMAQAADNE